MARLTLVSVIGDGNCRPDSRSWQLAKETGAALAQAGFGLLTGGLGGVMDAASAGAASVAGRPPNGIVALIPGGDPEHATPHADVVIPTSLGHARNAVVAQSGAVIAIGGGAGTLAEMAFAWIHGRIVIGMTGAGGWSGELAGRAIDPRHRHPHIPLGEDLVFPAGSGDEAVRILQEKLALYYRREA